MIWLAGWIEGEVFFPPSYLIWAGRLPSNFLGASSGHPIRSAKLESRISLASALRVLSAPPPSGHSHTRDRGGGAQTIFFTQSRGRRVCPCNTLSRDHSISQPSRSKAALSMYPAKQSYCTVKSVLLLVLRRPLGLSYSGGLVAPHPCTHRSSQSEARTRNQRHWK